MEIVNFLTQNWQYISAILVIVVFEIINFIFRRKKVVVEKGLLANIYSCAIQYINEAEEIFNSGQGEKKLQYVVERLKEMFPSLSKILDSKETVIDPFSSKDFYRSIVEDLLSTPQKKKVK